ncbi:dethiobiotin synthase [Hufsiella ginkgonis]|uniref:ATP-dependent dethiobiotin synthetase BioD n=1 Tax=Hufsiella ginkgonis TaxID=2695274 RepID=A0A7K1XX01_9SPHI|nr:dethiobiotin synthase [Hufsiella ginkgonis]MXV15521.1 dethiobiotin synthase [Hufsiella ginkgonis]
MKPIFVTGIGTGIGKTIVSAVLTELLQADYWKPIQAGDLEQTDTMTVQGLVINPRSGFHPEAYRLTQPFSPHKSAALDGITLDPERINIPETGNRLVIEGAGGLMVPINDHFLMLDLIKKFDAEVVLVSANYLGSINHTLLSLEVLRMHGVAVKGIIFNGDADHSSEKYILQYSDIFYLGRIPKMSPIDISSAVGPLSFLWKDL